MKLRQEISKPFFPFENTSSQEDDLLLANASIKKRHILILDSIWLDNILKILSVQYELIIFLVWHRLYILNVYIC